MRRERHEWSGFGWKCSVVVQASQGPLSSLNATQSPPPFTALPTTHGQMTTLPNIVKIHPSTHERPITIGFTDAASEATRRLCIGVACDEMTVSAAPETSYAKEPMPRRS